MNLATQIAVTTATSSANQIAAAERAADRTRLAGIVRAHKNGLELTKDDIDFLVDYHDPGEPLTARQKFWVGFWITLGVGLLLLALGWVGVFGYDVGNALHELVGLECSHQIGPSGYCFRWEWR